MYYCEIDENNICFHTTQNEIPLSDKCVLSETDVLGMIYNPETGTFSKREVEPKPELPTELERMEADIAYLKMTRLSK